MPRANATRVVIGVIMAAALIYARFLTAPVYGDEGHFFATTLALSPFHLDKLKTFRELSSPSFFIAFSFLISIVGPSLVACRVVVFLAFIATMVVFRQISAAAGRQAGAVAAAPDVALVLLLTFPYLLICGVFFYTDIPALLFGLLGFHAFERRRLLQAAAWITLAVHCRQFMVFIPMALAAADAWRLRARPAEAVRTLWVWAIPALSYLPYLLMWGGVSPMKNIYPTLSALPLIVPTHDSYLLAASGFYLWPVAVWLVWGRISPGMLLVAGAAATWITMAPPPPNQFFALIGVDIGTLGLLDSLLTRATPNGIRTIGMAIGAAVGAALHYELLARTPSPPVLRWLIGSFWVMNLFSHLTWDKYLLPVLPFIYLTALWHPRASGSLLRTTRLTPAEWRRTGGLAGSAALP